MTRPTNVVSLLRHLGHRLRLKLGLTPMQAILRELRRRGVDAASLHALEVFAAKGTMHTVDYADRVAAIEAWEVNPACEAELRRNLPRATIKIVDTFEQATVTETTYDFIVVDNPASTFGQADGTLYCEHFEALPRLFRLAHDGTVFVVNVITHAQVRKEFPHLFNPTQLERRAAFYATDHPQDIRLDEMMQTYRRLAAQYGFRLDWWFVVPRVPMLQSRASAFLFYLVFRVRRFE